MITKSIALIILAFVVGFFYSCATSRNINNHERCKSEIQDFISDKWFYNAETNTYIETKETIQINPPAFSQSDCVQLMRKDDLIDLFGKPSREDTAKNRMFYFYIKEDFDRWDSTRYCLYCMYIQLTDSGRVKSFVFPAFG